MKTNSPAILTVMLATTALIAQPAAEPPAKTSAAETALVPAPLSRTAQDHIAKMTSLFDGRTLNGWIQAPTNTSTLSGGDIVDLVALAKRISEKSDPVSAFLSDQLDETLRSDLAAYSTASTNTRALKSALTKSLNRLLGGPSLYDESRFQKVQLRSQTDELRKQNAADQGLVRLNRLLLEDAYPSELLKSQDAAWVVKDGAMASTGAGRGTIYTAGDYGKFRLIFTMRHVGAAPGQDHQPCVLIFCTRPADGQKGLDALGGIQFQVPNGGSWDYRPGHNNNGGTLFTRPTRTKFDNKQWCQVEILADAATGTARMAVAQPVGTRAVENLNFKDPTAGKEGPVAWQMHNGGLFDEFKDVRIEVNPQEDKLITTD